MKVPLKCPTCGRTETQDEQPRLTLTSGLTMPHVSGLDTANCAGCWDTLSQSGGVPFTTAPDGNGGHKLVPIPRPQEHSSFA